MRTWSQVAFCDCGNLWFGVIVSNPPPGAPAPLFSDALALPVTETDSSSQLPTLASCGAAALYHFQAASVNALCALVSS